MRFDPTVNFAWGTGSPIAGIAADTFSVRWTGSVLAPATGIFRFYTTTDDGVRLWVNGQSLINRWIDQGPTEWSGSIALEGGKSYNLQLDYYDNVGNAAASLSWWGPGIAAKGIIPQASLSPVPEWDSGDIGTVGIPGNATIDDSTGLYTVNGSGADIWGNGDDFFFVDQPLVGNGQIIARVLSVENTDAWAKAGVMIRESLASGARNAAMIVSPGNGLAFQRRVKAGSTQAHERRKVFSALLGERGAQWQQLHGIPIPGRRDLDLGRVGFDYNAKCRLHRTGGDFARQLHAEHLHVR